MSREIPLTRGYIAIVDDTDYEQVVAVGSWYARPDGRTVYAQRSLPRVDGVRGTLQLHTFLTGWSYVDHKNMNGLDNRRANLRPATASLNKANMAMRRDSATGFKGIARRPHDRWIASIGVGGGSRYLGFFLSAEDAARAYDAAAQEAYGEFAQLNFPEGVES